ncbi:MAG TPA: NTP transferase domain-containing protein [Candidatus Binataceae bacterium]|nr:NTP transferase domain-containing protein [Candidatus Binataceae bacterium]
MVAAFQGAIIAAGRGERLRASTGVELPKPLVEVGGAPLLARQANAMLLAGAEEVLAIVNSETASLAREGSFPPALRVIVRDTESSMESLFALGEHLRPGHFLLATVDAVVPRAEFDRFVGQARKLTAANAENKFDGVLAVVKWRGDHKPLFTEVTDSGLITSFGKRETSIVTAGMYWLPTAIFRLCAAARRRRLDAMRQFLQMLIEEGTRLGAVEVQDAIDIDEASDLAAARRMLAG